MKTEKFERRFLIWLPSILIAFIFIQNALGKIVYSGEMDKIVTNRAVLVSVGIILLFATALFMYSKTLILGTAVLSLYMLFIVFIHMYKGKPFEVAALILIATIFAAFLRKPAFFQQG